MTKTYSGTIKLLNRIICYKPFPVGSYKNVGNKFPYTNVSFINRQQTKHCVFAIVSYQKTQ